MDDPRLTNSRRSCFRRCQREHHFKYNLGYRAIREVPALYFGQMMHRALAAWWLAPREARLDAAIEQIGKEPGDPFDVARVRALMIGYHARWADAPYEALAIEVPFEASLLNPATGFPSKTWRDAGVIDTIIRDTSAAWLRKLICEHKTTSEDASPGSDYWKRLKLDAQIGAYYQGAKALGHEVEGCLYDVLVKPRERPYEATPAASRKYTKDGRLYAAQRERDETAEEYERRLIDAISAEPDRFYQRGIVVRLEEEIRDHAFDSWQIGRQIREGQLAGRHPRNPDACVRWGRACEFFAVCCGETRLEDSTQFEQLVNVHQELPPLRGAQPREEATYAIPAEDSEPAASA